MPLDQIWELIDHAVPRSELRAAVALIDEVAPPGVNPEAEWQAALCARLPSARRFIKILAETIEFGATADGFPVLEADVARLSPYMYAHINIHGHYTFQRPDLVGGRRLLRDPDAREQW